MLDHVATTPARRRVDAEFSPTLRAAIVFAVTLGWLPVSGTDSGAPPKPAVTLGAALRFSFAHDAGNTD